MKVTDEPIVVEQEFDASVETLWKALTDVDQMRLWYFDNIIDFKAEVGFETRFDIELDGRVFPHLWEVTEVDPLKKLVYNWKFLGYPGASYTLFELSKQDKSTKLKLTCVVTEDFPDEIPEFTRESGIVGWEYFIKKSLAEYLATNPA